MADARYQLLKGLGLVVVATVGCGDDDRGVLGSDSGVDGLAPARTAPAVDVSACLVSFEATVRSGPNAGTSLVGLLEYRLREDGALRDGTLHTIDGDHVEVTGSIEDLGVAMTFALPDGRSMTGTGAFEGPFAGCSGRLAGPLDGPDPDDRGDWLGDADATDDFTIPFDVLGTGGRYVVGASPAAHVVTLTDAFTGETVVVAGESGRAGGRERLSTPSAVVYVEGLIGGGSGLVVSDTGNARILYLEHDPRLATDLKSLFRDPVDLVTLERLGAALPVAPRAFQPRGLTTLRPSEAGAETPLYFADFASHVILRLEAGRSVEDVGAISVYAGAIGEPGYLDGERLTARLTGPSTMTPRRIEIERRGRIEVLERPSCRLRTISLRHGTVFTSFADPFGCGIAVGIGGMCDPLQVLDVCTAGSACVTLDGTSRCAAFGAVGAPCRSPDDGDVCDPTLTCVSGTCEPPVLDGGACGPSVPRPCAVGSSCVTSGGASTCRALGSDGGACRTAGAACDGALVCVAGVCRTTLGIDAECTQVTSDTPSPVPCSAGASCLPTPDGLRCRSAGTDYGLCRTTFPPCESGLRCDSPSGSAAPGAQCRRQIAPGGPCMGATLCPPDATCLNAPLPGPPFSYSGIERACYVDGAHYGQCRTIGARCDAGLSCSSSIASSGRCLPTLPVGARCSGIDGACDESASCRISIESFSAGDTTSVCIPTGAHGGACRPADPGVDRCNFGLFCHDNRTCRIPIPVGAECGSGGLGLCVTDSSCVQGATGSFCVRDRSEGGLCRFTAPPVCDPGLACTPENICVRAGALGNPCASVAPLCDPGLTCSPLTPANRCIRVLPNGAACDPRSIFEVCASMHGCHATSYTTGSCGLAQAEVEANDIPGTGPVTSSSLSIVGSASSAPTSVSLDCLSVDVPADASLTLRSRSQMPLGACTGDTTVVVYDSGVRQIATSPSAVFPSSGGARCAFMSGETNAALRSLAAGRYHVCVAPTFFGAFMSTPYLLEVGIVPP
ncbi:MAG: hypothetical protein IT379_03425 [Deltaproteobacteria bacterium]|nr:hypothetical protein [Deltaproteobacteria bacterium]